ncbi:MAG: hypothetical protein AAB250_19200, partial [Bdellovibrionota bacterium]
MANVNELETSFVEVDRLRVQNLAEFRLCETQIGFEKNFVRRLEAAQLGLKVVRELSQDPFDLV